MRNIEADAAIAGNEKNWSFKGDPQWREDPSGEIYPPVWSNPAFHAVKSAIPDLYAHNIAGEDYAFYTKDVFGDIDISVDFKAGYGSILNGGIVFRAVDDTRCYTLDIQGLIPKSQSYRLSLSVQEETGYRREIASCAVPHSLIRGKLAYGKLLNYDDWCDSFPEWVRVRVEATASYIRVSADGNIVMDLQDSTYLRGYAGLVARGAVCFRNLSIKGMPETAIAEGMRIKDGEKPDFFYPGGTQPKGFNAYPVTCLSENGSLLTAWYHLYTSNGRKRNTIVLTESADNGLTWTGPEIIYDNADRRMTPCSLFAHRDGSISMLAGCETGKDKYLLYRRLKGKKSWEQPEVFHITAMPDDDVYFFAPMRRLKDGTVYMTGYEYRAERRGTETDYDYFSRPLFFRSSDDGHTWDGAFCLDTGDFDHNEFVSAEIGENRLIAFIRSQKEPGMLGMISDDGGRTWVQPRKITAGGDHPHILMHSSGILLMTCRSFGYYMWYSTDKGGSWSPLWRISPASGIGAMTELDDGSILLMLHEGYKDPGHIRGHFFRITPDGPVSII